MTGASTEKDPHGDAARALGAKTVEPDHALRTRARSLAALARRQHLRANLVFLAAGLGFGSAVYLARTRFAALIAGGRATPWFVLVGIGIGAFALAARLHVRALRIDEERREVEDTIARRRGERDAERARATACPPRSA